MVQIAQSIVDMVLELVFGSVCLGCGARGRGMPCAECDRAVARLALSRGACFEDQSPVRELVRGAKFGRWRGGGAWFAARMVQSLCDERRSIVAVSWVPGDVRRVRERGVDFPRAVARRVARELGVPCVQLLTRVPGSRAQRGLHRFERDDNARASFDEHPRAIARCARLERQLALAGTQACCRDVLMIDDVCTTGATLRVCQTLNSLILRRRFGDVRIRPYALSVVPPPDPRAVGVPK